MSATPIRKLDVQCTSHTTSFKVFVSNFMQESKISIYHSSLFALSEKPSKSS
jgi:hypothetical protein